jgi:hypothetical protein
VFVSEESDLFTGKVRPFEVDRRRDRLEKLELSLDVISMDERHAIEKIFREGPFIGELILLPFGFDC